MAKRSMDFLVAGVALLFALPVLVFISICVWWFMGSPILFRQTRIGYAGSPFQILKFRTMTNERDCNGNMLPDQDRLNGFGRFLRSTSLDELPQLYNVLRGTMSLVGPRPLLVEYVPLYNARQARRHEVRPGITGWAQVNGRNALNWADKLELDVWYVENQSIWLDLKILGKTAKRVLTRDGIGSADSPTMTPFRGNDLK